MKLILKEAVANLGEPGDEVDVAAGYGRNYLLPKGLAVAATASNLQLVRRIKARREAQAVADREVAEALAGELSGVSVNIKRKVAEGDALYGSVTAADIVDALGREGHELDKSQVELDHAIKNLGIYDVGLALPYGVQATIKLWVVKEEGEEE